MKKRLVKGLLLCGLSWLHCALAQGVDPKLRGEVAAVQSEVARSKAALRQYAWTETTEVLVKGDVKSSRTRLFRYDASGELMMKAVGDGNDKDGKKDPSAISKRPLVRKKADMEDYIERAISLIQSYVPPNPDQIQHMVENGEASLGRSETGKSEIRFKNYYQNGDSMVFTYDTVSKVLVGATISSNLGGPKDPVLMEAIFETLPDGVNHLSSTTLNATKRKVQVKTKNTGYEKVGSGSVSR